MSSATSAASTRSNSRSSPTRKPLHNEMEGPPSLGDRDSRGSSPLLDTAPLPSDEHANCPYCHKAYRKPRVLDCLHSMCEDCIIAQLDGRRDAAEAKESRGASSTTDCELESPKVERRPTPPGVIRCPICAQESHVGNDVRFVHSMLIDYVRMNSSAAGGSEEGGEAKGDCVSPPPVEERKCGTCKSEQAAVAECHTCRSDLCPNCQQAHKDMRLFITHVVYPLSDKKAQSPVDPATNERAVMCPAHGRPFSLLCATCETLTCKSCMTQAEHIGHKVVEVNELVTMAIQQELRKTAEAVNTKWRNVMSEWSSGPDRVGALYEQYETAKARLDSAFEQMSSALADVRRAKQLELEAARDKHEDALSQLDSKMSANEARVGDAVEFARRLVDQATGVQMVASRRKVMQQLNTLRHTMPSLAATALQLEFRPPTLAHMNTHLAAAVGDVICRTTVTAGGGGGNDGASPSDEQKQPPPQQGMSMPPPSTFPAQIVAGMGVGVGGGGLGVEDEWKRKTSNGGSNGTMLGAMAVPPHMAPPGAIGEGRRRTQLGSSGSTAGFGSMGGGGWPPSSNPPDLPTPSPPKELAPGAQRESNGLGSGVTPQSMYSKYPWPPSSTPAGAMAGPDLPAGPPPRTMPLPEPNSRMDARTAHALFGAPPPSLGVPSGPSSAAAALSLGGVGGGSNAQLTAQAMAQLQQQVKLLQQGVSGAGAAHAAALLANPMLMAQVQAQAAQAARMRGMPPLNPLDPQILSAIGALSMDTMNGSPLNGTRTPPQQMEQLAAAVGAALKPFAMQGAGGGVPELKLFSMFGAGVAGQGQRELHSPGGFALSDNDDILIADTNNHRIVVCGPGKPQAFGRAGQAEGELCFPKKVVALKGEPMRYVVFDKGAEGGKTRAQIFDQNGQFTRRISLAGLARGGVDVAAACATGVGQQVAIVCHNCCVYMIDLDVTGLSPRVLAYFDASKNVGEASDIAVRDSAIYISDFKHHCVHVYGVDGQWVRRLGDASTTPYPVGVDVGRNGEVMVLDTHGNHAHIVVFAPNGSGQQQFSHNEHKMSRCVGLRVAASGHLLTLSKQAHTLFVFKPLFSR